MAIIFNKYVNCRDYTWYDSSNVKYSECTENIDYGNALYILFDNWQEICQMSRIDILKRHEHDFIRIIHKDGWQKALKRHIDELKSQNK